MKKNIFLAVVLAASMALFSACEKAKIGDEILPEEMPSAEGAAMQEAGLPSSASAATISITPEGGAPINFTVMIAETDAQKAQGLKNVETLAPGHGMWFVFAQEGTQSFWMKDTMMPLDWIFVKDDDEKGKKVVYVKMDNQPCVPGEVCPDFAPPTSFRYVLEVNAGEAKAINVGDAVDFRIGPAE